MSCPRCDTLLQFLAIDTMAPEIFLEEDGDICLDYNAIIISIGPKGGVNWAAAGGRHGTDLEEIIGILRNAG